MQPGFHSGAAARPLSAFLRLAMMGCPVGTQTRVWVPTIKIETFRRLARLGNGRGWGYRRESCHGAD